ncbi:MAG: hypothetical protein U5L45_25470 [Saprospiraceae bacterium]|nr:hypothetical protein [Saprospiraceae bacterium]
MKAFLFIYLFLCATLQAQPVRTLQKKFTPLSISTSFGGQKPAGDLAARFGNNLAVGIGIEYTIIPSGWLFNVESSYLFGTTVKEDVLALLRTTDGNIINDINSYADVSLRERGLYTGVTLGKIFKLHDNGNRFGGIRVSLGGGWLYHKIRIQDNQDAVAQLSGEYARGYDRFTAGVATTQFIGYQVVSRDRTINFYIGLEAVEGFTKNRRGFNFDTGRRDDLKRIDLLYGVRVGWQLAIFTNYKGEDIEY